MSEQKEESAGFGRETPHEEMVSLFRLVWNRLGSHTPSSEMWTNRMGVPFKSAPRNINEFLDYIETVSRFLSVHMLKLREEVAELDSLKARCTRLEKRENYLEDCLERAGDQVKNLQALVQEQQKSLGLLGKLIERYGLDALEEMANGNGGKTKRKIRL